MLQVTLPLLVALHLTVAPAHTNRLVVGPQVQSSSVFSYELLQPTIPGIKLQGSSAGLQASVYNPQPALGEGVSGWSLQ